MIHENLKKFANLVQEWSPKINLVSIKSLPNIWERHIIDCLQLNKFLESWAQEILDVGAGAGFPGVVLAITNERQITLLEKDLKKIAFLRHVRANLGLENLTLIDKRWEEWETIKRFDLVTARAFLAMDTLLQVGYKFLKKDGYALFMKGKDWEVDYKKSLQYWKFDSDIHRSETDENSRIICIRNIRPR